MAGLKTPMAELYVQPGESHLVTAPTMIRTLLGSCVGVTFRCARLGIAALCHPMLPTAPKATSSGVQNPAPGPRFVDFAILDLIRQFEARGARRDEIEIKLFGGADVLIVNNPDESRPTVGKLNAEMAVKLLDREGLEVRASCLGGDTGYFIHFNTETGEVLLRRLK